MKIDIPLFLSISKEVFSTMEPLLPEGVLCNLRVRSDSVKVEVRNPESMEEIASVDCHLKPKAKGEEFFCEPEITLTGSVCSSDMDVFVDSIVVLRSMAKALKHRFNGVKVIP